MDVYAMNQMWKYAEVAQRNWYLTSLPQKPSCKFKVEFADGKSYFYRSDKEGWEYCTAVIASGCQSSFAMGKITDCSKLTAGKSHLTPVAYVFGYNPKKPSIVKSVSRICDICTIEDLDNVFSLKKEFCENYRLSEREIENILCAINVVANKDLVTTAQIKKATFCLVTPKKLCSEFWSSNFQQYVSNWSSDGYSNDIVWTVTLSGFYKGWTDKITALPIWKQLSETENSYGIEAHNGTDGSLSFVANKCNEEIKKLIDDCQDLHTAYNEIVFRSALSIIIRGGFTNMLAAALKIPMPIKDFYEDLCELAKNIGSIYCYELLMAEKENVMNRSSEELLYAAKESAQKAIARAAKKADKTIVASPDFRIEKEKIVKYLGDDEVVVIPEGIKWIGESAFCGNKKIKKVIFSETVLSISFNAFGACSNLQEVVFNKKLHTIGKDAFDHCDSLEKVDLSHTAVRSIGSGAFSCRNLLEVHLSPKTEKVVDAFYYSKQLRDVYIYGEHPLDFIPYGDEPTVIHCVEGSPVAQRVIDSKFHKFIVEYL